MALGPTVPGFLARTGLAAQPVRDGRVLVVIELNGGNDGINTVVPFADEGYAKYRKVLRLPADQLLKINKEVGLHPAMGDAAKLLESGRLAVVQGVGYPNPSRSHFVSMAIWQSGNVRLSRQDDSSSASTTSYGWIGRALDDSPKPPDRAPGAIVVGSESVPATLRGRNCVVSSLTRLEDCVLDLKGIAVAANGGSRGDGDLAAFVRRSTLDAYASSERVAAVLRAPDKGADYPPTALAGRLRTIARLIEAGGGTRVFYTGTPRHQGHDYDTHMQQLPQHAILLRELSGALKAFLDDLSAAKLAERVVVL
jgi:uncharacterized protein (DUF1501 family)